MCQKLLTIKGRVCERAIPEAAPRSEVRAILMLTIDLSLCDEAEDRARARSCWVTKPPRRLNTVTVTARVQSQCTITSRVRGEYPGT